MRDIKFRAYIKNKNPKVPREINKMVEVKSLHLGSKKAIIGYSGGNYSIKFDEIELMQYVGLKDKNGKEIYEGDIVKFRFKDDREEFPDLIGYIEYQTTFTAFRIMSNQGSFKIDITEIKFIEVIGNIYENPKLLEEGE